MYNTQKNKLFRKNDENPITTDLYVILNNHEEVKCSQADIKVKEWKLFESSYSLNYQLNS